MAFSASMFWTTDGNGDGPAGGYSRARWSELLLTMFGEGVVRDAGAELVVTGTASPMSVGTGAAVVDGIFGSNPTAEDVTVPTPSVGTTGHRIVLRATWGTTQTLRVALLSNADGVPLATQIPALTQTRGSLYEIPLARFDIDTGGVVQGLVDERVFLSIGGIQALTDVPDGFFTANATGRAKFATGFVNAALLTDGAGSGVDADLLDGQHGSHYATASGLAAAQDDINDLNSEFTSFQHSNSIQAATAWTIPNGSYGDVSGLSLQITLAGTSHLFIYATVNLVASGADTNTNMRAAVDSTALDIYTELHEDTRPRVFNAHWFFGSAGPGTRTVKVQMSTGADAKTVSNRRLSVIAIPQ